MASVLNAKPDGYTLCAGNSDTLNINPLFTKDLPFNTIEDVNYIVKVANFPQSLVVRTESPFKTLDDVIAYARANPKKLKASTPGTGTNPAMALRLLELRGQGGHRRRWASRAAGKASRRFWAATWTWRESPCRPPNRRSTPARSASWPSSRRSATLSIRTSPQPMKRATSRPSSTRGWASSGPKGLPAEVIKKWEQVVQTPS